MKKGDFETCCPNCGSVVCWVMGFQTKYGDDSDRSKGNVWLYCHCIIVLSMCIYLMFMHDYAGQGDVIPAMIKKEDIATWEDKLKEGKSYIMHNFKIHNNRAQYRVCDHPFKLLFIGETSVWRQPIASIPAKVWKFKSIKDIIDGNYSADWLVSFLSLIHICLLFFCCVYLLFCFSILDVIGVVDNVEEKPSSKNVVFDLKDLRYNWL